MTALRDLVPNPSAAELELVAAYAAAPSDPRRERQFQAFAKTGLPHRRMENWRWSDFKAAVKPSEGSAESAADDPLETDNALVFRVRADRIEMPSDLPSGVRLIESAQVQAVAGAEDLPMVALAASLSGGKSKPGALMFEVSETPGQRIHFVFESSAEAVFSNISFVVRPGVKLDVSESYLSTAGLTAALLDLYAQPGAEIVRTMFQKGAETTNLAATCLVRLEEGAKLSQTSLVFGGKVTRFETRVTHEGTGAEANINAAYLVSDRLHADFTTHIRHGAPSCVTRQVTKGAVRDGGTGVFQGKFFVPRTSGQHTDADMQHNALLLEEGATVFAKPELEIYADDVECAHGNTCGALDDAQLFYLRQRGIPEAQAKAMLTEAFVAEVLDSAGELSEILREEAGSWLKDT